MEQVKVTATQVKKKSNGNGRYDDMGNEIPAVGDTLKGINDALASAQEQRKVQEKKPEEKKYCCCC